MPRPRLAAAVMPSPGGFFRRPNAASNLFDAAFLFGKWMEKWSGERKCGILSLPI